MLVLILIAIVGFTADLQMGNWKLNEAKSQHVPSMGKNLTTVFEPEGDGVKVTVDGVNGDGSPRHNEWVGKFDGKDYSITGDPSADTRAYSIVDDRTLLVTQKKNGKTTIEGTAVISADGKTRTLTIQGKDSNGKKFEMTIVYDKQ